MSKAERDIRRKLAVLKHYEERGNVAKACRHFGISRTTFYNWKRNYEKLGNEGLVNHKPCPENPRLRVDPVVEEKIVYLRTTYHLGPVRICWFMQRYHPQLKVSKSGAYRVLRRRGLNRLPRNTSFPPSSLCATRNRSRDITSRSMSSS